MLLVLQGPMGSGKTQLAAMLQELSPGLVLYDNVSVNSFTVDAIRNRAKLDNVIVTTTNEWPDSDWVWKLQPIDNYKQSDIPLPLRVAAL